MEHAVWLTQFLVKISTFCSHGEEEEEEEEMLHFGSRSFLFTCTLTFFWGKFLALFSLDFVADNQSPTGIFLSFDRTSWHSCTFFSWKEGSFLASNQSSSISKVILQTTRINMMRDFLYYLHDTEDYCNRIIEMEEWARVTFLWY